MATAAETASKLDRTDPRVRKLVYNMYRNVLGNYNDKANAMLEALPENQVTQDQGIDRQLSSILHQIGAKNLAGDMSATPPLSINSGGTSQGGPPPPPPPPPMLHSGHIPAIRIKTELNEPREIPSTIQNAMATKDKKPFTYLPGGLDLSEIRSPRMQRRLERNAQTPPSPEQVPQRLPEYQSTPPPPPPPQQVVKQNFEQKPVCNVRSAAERVCLLPQVQHQPQLNKAPTPWMQKAAQIQPNPAPWTQNKKEYIVDQVDKSEERVVPVRVETIRQVSSQPLKNNINHSYDSEPIQGRSFKVLQQITEPKSVYDGSQPYNSQSLPLSELRKLQLNDDDQSFMNRVKSQANVDMENPRYRGGSIPSKIFKVLDNSVDDDKFLHNETDPRYRGASIPSRSFRMLQTLTNSAPVPLDNNKQTIPINNYVSVKPIESKIYVPPSERPVGMEPHKYTGGSIPSRSFRMLQAMTGQNNEEDDENDLRNQSISPYPFSCPEFWQHYNYLKEFHDRHTTDSDLQQQQTAQSNDVTATMPCSSTDAAYTAHVLNTIDEEETAEDDKQSCVAAATAANVEKDENFENRSDSVNEWAVTVTIKLPTNSRTNTAEKDMTIDSPVDFWQQINDGGSEARDKAETSSPSTAESDSDSSDNATLQSPSGGTYLMQVVSDHELRRSKSEDADSGITCASSADFNRMQQLQQQQQQTSEIQDVNNGDGSAKKYYQRTCTHSRLFDFLRDGEKHSADAVDVPMMQSSCTSGYSSAATTPTTPSARGKYESDSNRTDYDNYYKSWEYACPYFGYNILPSKAFKSIMQGGCSSTTAAVKFKCPKIPTENNES